LENVIIVRFQDLAAVSVKSAIFLVVL